MATTPVRMLLPPGLGTLTLRLYQIDGVTVDHESSVAESSVPGRWTWSVTEALSGDYEAVVANADDNVVAGGRVRLADTEGLHWVDAAASQASVDGNAVAIAAVQTTADAVQVKTDLLGTGQVQLTQAGVTAGGELVLRVASFWSGSLTGLGDLSGSQKIWVTVKRSKSDPDDAAVVQWSNTSGLLHLDRKQGVQTSWGSLTVDDVSNGDITLTLEADATALLRCALNLVYDVKSASATGKPTVIAEGVARIEATVTRAIA